MRSELKGGGAQVALGSGRARMVLMLLEEMTDGTLQLRDGGCGARSAGARMRLTLDF